MACVLLLVLNTGIIYTPALWLLAADVGITFRKEEKIKKIKKIEIIGIIIITSFIASSSIIIIIEIILKIFIGLPLRGVVIF